MDVDFQKRLDKMNIDAKIEASAKTNEGRIKRMVERNACMEKVKHAAKEKLMGECGPKSPVYKETLKNLIVQVSSHFSALIMIFCRVLLSCSRKT